VQEWQKRDDIELVLTIDRLRLPLTGCGVGRTPVCVLPWIVLGDNRVYN